MGLHEFFGSKKKTDPTDLFHLLSERIRDVVQKDTASIAHLISCPDMQMNRIELELWFYYLHIADRALFNYLGPEKRAFVMDRLALLVGPMLFQKDANTSLKFTQLYGKRQTEYASYRMRADAEQPLEGNLFWEFSRRISNQWLDYPDSELMNHICEIISKSTVIIGEKGLHDPFL